MKKILLTSVCITALAACSPQSDENASHQEKMKTETMADAGPRLGDFGIELTAIDKNIRPQDDFYAYVNGTWLKETEIPADKSNYGSFNVLADEAETRIRTIIEEVAAQQHEEGSEAQKIGDLYASFIDEEAVNGKGLSPIKADLNAIDEITSHDDVALALANSVIEGGNSPFNMFINQDSKSPEDYISYFTQTGLGLPDRDYYLKDEERTVEIREKYVAYIEELLTLAGVDAGADKAAAVMELETKLAEVFWSRAESRDRNKTYNKFTRDELVAEFEGFSWGPFLDKVGLGQQTSFIVRQPSSLKGSAEIFANTSVDVWKAYLTFHMLNGAAPLLSSDYVDLAFDFNEKVLFGVPQNRERWKRAVSMVENGMGEAVGKIYVARHFKPEAKEEMEGLVDNLVQAFEISIKDLEWMGEETKAEALDKLAKFDPKIGYPSKWRDYSKLLIKKDDLIGNAKRISSYEHWRGINKLGKPIDRTEWGMTPQEVNAYYNSTKNEIVFPAGILQPPFFDLNADPAVNYGGIGAVIGHEIGHGFDDQGSKSDGTGLLRDWWSEEDLKRFKTRTDALVAQYDAYEPLPGEFVNGRLTLGENIGDLGGLGIAYEAYKLSLNGKEAPVIDGFTGDQRFFMAWAQVWRRLYRDATLSYRLKIDPHSPSEQRTNGIVRNLDAWYDAFDVKEGDALYLPPEKRVSIW